MRSYQDRQLAELTAFRAHDAHVLSVYLYTDPRRFSRADVADQINILRMSLEDGLTSKERAALQVELAEVKDYLWSMLAPPVAVAIFTCAAGNYFRVVRLHVPVGPAAFWAPMAHVAILRDAHQRERELELQTGNSAGALITI